MKPVASEHTADCFRACVASVLNMPLSGVPAFMDGLAPGDAVGASREADMLDWFRRQGLYLIGVPLTASSPALLLRGIAEHHPGLHCIVCGMSARGRDHAVIARDGEIVHDPARIALGLSGPQSDGCYSVYFVGLLV